MVDTFSSGDPWDDPRKRQMSPAQFPGLLDSSQMPGRFPPVGGPQGSPQGDDGIQGGGAAGNAPAGLSGAPFDPMAGSFTKPAGMPPTRREQGVLNALFGAGRGLQDYFSGVGQRAQNFANQTGAAKWAPQNVPPQVNTVPPPQAPQLAAMGLGGNQVQPIAQQQAAALPPPPQRPPGMVPGQPIPFPQAGPPPQMPPQGAGQPPPTNQGIPPSSAAGRMPPQPQQGGDPLRQYLQQMMALQRQRQQLAMAGGLLGAPSLGIGLGRAFTNAAETMPGAQGNMMNQIMGAQAAGQLIKSQGGTDKDVQAAQARVAFGGQNALYEAVNPRFEKRSIGGQDLDVRIWPSGRQTVAESGFPTWAHEIGFKDKDGKPTKDYTQADRRPAPDGSGKTAYRMADGTWRTMDEEQ